MSDAKALRAAILCLLLAGATLSGCSAPAGVPDDGSFRCVQRGHNGWCRVWHDDKRAVTCWEIDRGGSCLPDWQFGSAATAPKAPSP